MKKGEREETEKANGNEWFIDKFSLVKPATRFKVDEMLFRDGKNEWMDVGQTKLSNQSSWIQVGMWREKLGRKICKEFSLEKWNFLLFLCRFSAFHNLKLNLWDRRQSYTNQKLSMKQRIFLCSQSFPVNDGDKDTTMLFIHHLTARQLLFCLSSQTPIECNDCK